MPQEQVQEISLRNAILTARHYLLAGLRAWLWVVLAALLMGGCFLYSALNSPVLYEARFSFVINNSQKSNSGGLGSVLGQLAIGGSSSGANLRRINSFVGSRELLNEVMLDSATVDGRADLIAKEASAVLICPVALSLAAELGAGPT